VIKEPSDLKWLIAIEIGIYFITYSNVQECVSGKEAVDFVLNI